MTNRKKTSNDHVPDPVRKVHEANNAAMKIAGGMSVNEAANTVGYVSSSQFNREFKRMYGKPPRQWSNDRTVATEAVAALGSHPT